MENKIIVIVLLLFVCMLPLTLANHEISEEISCIDVDTTDFGTEFCDDNDFFTSLSIGTHTIITGLPKIPELRDTRDTVFPGGRYLEDLINNIKVGSTTYSFATDEPHEFEIDGILIDYNLDAIWKNGELRTYTHNFLFNIDTDKIIIRENDVQKVKIGSNVYQKILVENNLLNGLELTIDDKRTSLSFLIQDFTTQRVILKKGTNRILVALPSDRLGEIEINRNFIINILDEDILIKESTEEYFISSTLVETDDGVAIDPKEDTVAYIIEEGKDYINLLYVLIGLGLVIVFLVIIISRKK